jgi:hypothetical protein
MKLFFYNVILFYKNIVTFGKHNSIIRVYMYVYIVCIYVRM